MEKRKQSFQKPHIGKFVAAICERYELDGGEVAAFLVSNFPELKNKEKCANCGESMAEYIYSVSILDADLLCAMARVVSERMENGMSFTSANKIKINREIGSYSLASRQTIASKLGLVAKVMIEDEDGNSRHDLSAGWCITRRGYDFLQGQAVPRKVLVFRNQIQERFEDDKITMAELYKGNNSKIDNWQKWAGILVERYHSPKLL